MKRFLFFALFVAASSVAATIYADVRLPEAFSSNMVLQRDMKVPIWGRADAGEKVTVSFGSQSKSATTAADGTWQVELDPLTMSAEPATLTIKGNNELKLDNVLVGDVWLCSGQSNMEWSLSRSDGGKEEIENSTNPNIRLLQVNKAWKTTPQTELPTKGWTECNPTTTPGFSGVGYFFGKKLNADLNVPIGLINSSWGGTRIEPWTTPAGFQKVPTLSNISDEIAAKDPSTSAHKELVTKTLQEYRDWIKATEKNLADGVVVEAPPAFPAMLTPYTDHQKPTVLHNAMVHPFVPLAMRGVIWYQGESNLGDGMLYAEKMKALIEGWRMAFKNPQLGFYYAQLAPYTYGGSGDALPRFWVAQGTVEKALPYCGMAVINDVGNIKDIHPTNKRVVGDRLALLAENRTYGKSDIVCASPELDSMDVEGNAVVLKMKNAKSLKTRDGKAPDWFEIAGADAVYKKADARIDGTTITLTNGTISKPYAMRYAWDMIAEPNVQNEAGLQLSAFRAGEIPERGNLDTLLPEAKNFKLLYTLNPLAPRLTDNNTRIAYTTDKSKEIVGKVKRIGYFLYLQKKGEKTPQYVFVTMAPLSPELGKLGVPTKATGARFQQKVNNVTVASNVDGVETGTFADGCNVEFWDCNYGAKNTGGVPGASDEAFDFGDEMSTGNSPGYGSMQIHNFAKKQTVFAFNNFGAGPGCDIGIGNCPTGTNPDWTFSHSAGSYEGGQMMVLVETE